MPSKTMKNYKQIICGVVFLVLFGVGDVCSRAVTSETAIPVYPEKTVEQVREAVDFLRNQTPQASVKVEEFSSPIDYMRRLRRLRIEFPNRFSGEVGKGETRSTEKGSIEQCVHNWNDSSCVKEGIPKVYKETMLRPGKNNCSDCNGVGYETVVGLEAKKVKCPLCSGTGKLLKALNPAGLTQVQCDKCLGKGEISSEHRVANEKKCRTCSGTGKLDCMRSQWRFLILVPLYLNTGI